jgi:hypothetical protein
MESGVYIGSSTTGDYGLISTGDYIAPVTNTFKLKDTKESLIQEQQLYVIVSDIEVEFIQVALTGAITNIRCLISWDGAQWSNTNIKYNAVVDAKGKIITIPFKFRAVVDDFLEQFSLTGENIYKQYKFRLTYV